MKKKIYLIAVFLCAISILIVFSKNIYLKNREKEFTENVIEYLETENKKKSKQESTIYEENLEKDINCIESGEIVLSKNNHKEIGMIIIPSLELKAPIYEGTNKNVLKYTVRTFYRN